MFLTFVILFTAGCDSSQKLKITYLSREPVFTAKISNISCLSLSPDNRIVYMGTHDKKIIAYDTDRMAPIPLEITCRAMPTRIAVHPNGTVIGIGMYDGNIELWDISKNKQIMFISGHKKYIGSLSFSSTGSMVMAAYQYGINLNRDGKAELGLNPVIIWDTNSGAIIQRFDGHECTVGNAIFSIDGNSVFSAASEYEKGFLQWDIKTGHIIRKFAGAYGFKGIHVLPDSNSVTGFLRSGKIMKWNIQEPNKPIELYDMSDRCHTIRFSHDGNITAIGTGYLWVPTMADPPLFTIPMDCYVKLFDVKGRRKLLSLTHHDPVSYIALSSDGHTLVSHTNKDGLRVWKFKFTE